MTRSLALASLLALAGLAVANDAVLTLDQALEVARKSALPLRLAERDVDEARFNRKLAVARFAPLANLSAAHSYSNFEAGPGGFGASGNVSNTALTLSAQQPIDISGRDRDRLRAANFGLQAAETGLETAWNQVKGDVRAQYFVALQAQEIVGIQVDALKANEARLANARKAFEAGSIPRFEVIRLETLVKASEQELVQARGTFRLAKQVLNNVLGRLIETDFEIQAPSDPAALQATPMQLVALGLRTRPDLKALRLSVLGLEANAKAEAKAADPSLTVSALYLRNLDPGFGQSRAQSSAQLELSWPIVTGGAVKAAAGAARNRADRVEIQLEQAQLGVALAVLNAVTQYETALESKAAADQNVVLATEALRLAQLRYDEGAGILLDVTTAQADLTAASNRAAAARFQVRLAFAQLQLAVGQDDLSAAVTARTQTKWMEDKR